MNGWWGRLVEYINPPAESPSAVSPRLPVNACRTCAEVFTNDTGAPICVRIGDAPLVVLNPCDDLTVTLRSEASGDERAIQAGINALADRYLTVITEDMARDLVQQGLTRVTGYQRRKEQG